MTNKNLYSDAEKAKILHIVLANAKKIYQEVIIRRENKKAEEILKQI